MFSEDLFKVKGVEFTNISNAKIINNQEKRKRTPFVEPEARSEGKLVVVMGVDTFIEKSVGEGSWLGKAIDFVADFKINPAVNIYVVVYNIFINEVLSDVIEFDADVLCTVYRVLEVKVFDVKS